MFLREAFTDVRLSLNEKAAFKRQNLSGITQPKHLFRADQNLNDDCQVPT